MAAAASRKIFEAPAGPTVPLPPCLSAILHIETTCIELLFGISKSLGDLEPRFAFEYDDDRSKVI